MSKRWPLMAFLCLIAAASMLAAAPATVPAQAQPTSPPATWTPGPAPEKTPLPSEGDSHAGGTIELWVQPLSTQGSVWTEVEWLDEFGAWRAVAGWHGPPDELVGSVGRKRWWFDSSLGGKGPFRWVVYGREGGPRLAISEEFDLPLQGTRIVQIDLGAQYPLLPESGNISIWRTLMLAGSGLLVVAVALAAALRRREA